jgi:lipopolysaccharide transport protein LptA
MISRIKSLLIIYLLFATNVISDMAINNIFINSKIIEIEKDTNKISFEGDVNIKSGEFTINADNASYDNLKKIIYVSGNPSKIKSVQKNNSFVGSAHQIIFSETSKIQLIGNAVMNYDDINISSNEIIFNTKDGKIISD